MESTTRTSEHEDTGETCLEDLLSDGSLFDTWTEVSAVSECLFFPSSLDWLYYLQLKEYIQLTVLSWTEIKYINSSKWYQN